MVIPLRRREDVTSLPHWFVLRSEPEEMGARIMHMHTIADIVARVPQA